MSDKEDLKSLKPGEITALFEVFTKIEYGNEKVISRIFRNLQSAEGIKLEPYDVYTLWLYEAAQNKTHPADRLEFLVSKAKEIIPESGAYIVFLLLTALSS